MNQMWSIESKNNLVFVSAKNSNGGISYYPIDRVKSVNIGETVDEIVLDDGNCFECEYTETETNNKNTKFVLCLLTVSPSWNLHMKS